MSELDSVSPARTAEEVLTFWFGPPGDRARPRREWFIKNPEFDARVAAHLLPLHERAAREELPEWRSRPDACLALVILLDQVPRNVFREQPRMFATDPLALATARVAIAARFDRQVPPVQRWFFYLPFEHSEAFDDQQRSLELFDSLRDDPDSASVIAYARRHHDVIARFGRFPHRNPILGRASTPAEAEFLQQPGARF